MVSNMTTDPSIVLDFNRVSKAFTDGPPIISDFSLTVARGQFLSIVGPSGCGKSTLLRIAAGLEKPTEGICGVDNNSIGYVFQDPTLLPWRNARSNINLFAELQLIDKLVVKDRVDDVVELVGLREHQEKYPRQLSGGMRMRVSLARSLVLRPQLFLLDEPFSALDEINRQRLNDEILQIFVQEQFGVLFVTHSVAEAVYLSSEIIVMSAPPGEIKKRIKVPFAYPRDPDLRYDPLFASVALEVSQSLRETQI